VITPPRWGRARCLPLTHSRKTPGFGKPLPLNYQSWFQQNVPFKVNLRCYCEEACPFSIHSIITAWGKDHGLVAGKWLGPCVLARVGLHLSLHVILYIKLDPATNLTPGSECNPSRTYRKTTNRQLITASMVHVTKLTPGGGGNRTLNPKP
jgi:hypothetical protein